MGDVRWIKIATDIFDDEKMLLIESMPRGESMVVIWLKLLCLAGKQNNSGVLKIGTVAYTPKMLATLFRCKEGLLENSLKVFETFGMIQTVEGVITISNWGKHQNLDQLESKKEYMKKYMQDYREKQRNLSNCKTNSKSNSKSNSKDLHKANSKDLHKANVSCAEIDKDIDIYKEKNIIKKESGSVKKVKHKYGEYNNVLLTDEELERLKSEYQDWEERVERLSAYVESTGKSYKSHYATIRCWARKDVGKSMNKPKSRFNNAPEREYNMDDLERQMLGIDG